MTDPAPAEYLSPAQRRLFEAHRERLPLPEAGLVLLGRWAESAPFPAAETSFLHLFYLASLSETLFLSLLRRPGQLGLLSAQVGQAEGLGRDGLEEALARFLLSHREGPPASGLSAFRSLQTARILIQDVLGILPFEKVVSELSDLADVLIARAFAVTFQPLRETLGLPMWLTPEGRSAQCPLAVFALGKLGGRELNYSSDVDLVGFFRAPGETDRGHTNQAFFNAWLQSATALLTTPTPDGPCLRVDTNLRPRGRDGELTLSFDAALAYYREWADAWERQAWIKARPCAGDAAAGGLFMRAMEEEVYRPYAFGGIAASVNRLREKTLAELRRRSPREPEANVKEGRGSIRDAEFSVQALQMAHGQADRWIREGHTLLAMQKLEQKGRLSPARRSAMSEAYVLLRRAEHWSQAQAMRQTHRLPPDDAGWDALARFLGLASGAAAREEVDRCRAWLEATRPRVMAELAAEGSESDELQALMSPEGMREVLRRGRIPDAERAAPHLSALYAALAPHLDTEGRRLHFIRNHFALQREFERAPDPYQGLVNLSRLVVSVAGEPDLLRMMLDRPRLMRLLFRLVSRSEPALDALMRWPHLCEVIGYEDVAGVEADIPAWSRRAADADGLRRWRQEILLKARVREIVGGEGLVWSQKVMTDLADATCWAVFQETCRKVEDREGLAPGTLSGGLTLLGLGRLGFGEMHPASDLDLVCVKREAWVLPGDAERSAAVESRFMQALVAGFTAVTRHGSLYDVDLRLRPYGESGPPVQSLAAYLSYFEGPARLWERVSFLKARRVAGAPDLGDALLHGVWDRVLAREAPRGEVDDLLALREKLGAAAKDLEAAVKFGPGGLLHLDLLVHVLQIRAELMPGPGGGGPPCGGRAGDTAAVQ